MEGMCLLIRDRSGLSCADNGQLIYNHSRPWISHVSLQGLEQQTPGLRSEFGKPAIWDEVQYEGDIPMAWGSLSGQQEADRFWWGASLGGATVRLLVAPLLPSSAPPAPQLLILPS